MSCHGVPDLSVEALSASGKDSDKLILPALQSKMKCDPEGYESELILLYNQFNSSLELFQQQSALSFTSISGISVDSTVAKELGERAMFLAHVTPFYPNYLSEFPKQLADLLRTSARSLPSSLRCHFAQALILLINKKVLDIKETLALFTELQTLRDKTLKNLAFAHVIQSIRRMNQKHKNDATNRALQNILFALLQQEDEVKAKRSLITLCDLHRRKVWFDDRTANEICRACFHPSSRIMIAALSFLLDYENVQDEDDSDGWSSEDDSTPQNPQALISKQDVYKANHKGTLTSKKKKKAKLQRAMRSMKRKQRLLSENSTSNYYSPLNHLKDPQGFAEKLLSVLKKSGSAEERSVVKKSGNTEVRFEVKMMMLKVIARTIGLHRLILLDFYRYLQKYAQPHQRDVTSLLAAGVQACHDMVPPDAVEPLFRQIVNQFIHDRSRPEAIAVGLNVVREICLRMPLLMTEDLLQDLVMYKKTSHEKAVSTAARSLVTLFREICPSLLSKKDRGRPTNKKAKPKAFGEVNIDSDVPGVELLKHSDEEDEDDIDAEADDYNDDDDDDDGEIAASDDEQNQLDSDADLVSENDLEEENESEDDEEAVNEDDNDDDIDISDDDEGNSGEDDGERDEDEDEDETAGDNRIGVTESKAKKRKFSDFDQQMTAADSSLRVLRKKLAAGGKKASDLTEDGILSNEDFQRIKERKANKEARTTLTNHGLLKKGTNAKSPAFKIPSSDQLSLKRVDPAMLEVNVRKKLSKEERLALVKAGREDRGKYQARAAIKQKKTGGSSNRQKEHKKAMPLAAKRSKIAKTNQQRKIKKQRAGKQFRGKKAWK